MNDPNLTDIYLHGALGEEFGNHWKLDVQSPAEAVHALAVLRPGFLPAIERLNAVVEGFVVQVGDRQISEALLPLPSEGQRIDITPILQGADTKGILQIVAGVALIAVGVALAFTGVGAFLGTYAATIGLQVGLLGVALALGGVARLMMSTPGLDSKDEKKQRASYAFSGVVNTSGQGQCVPVFFGEMIIGSAVVSAGMESADVQSTGGSGGPGGGIGYQPGPNEPPITP